MKSSIHHLLRNGLPYGIIAGLLIVIVRAAVYLFNVNQTNVSFAVFNFVYNAVVLFLCLYLGTLAYRKKNKDGNLSFGQGLVSCIWIGFITIFIIYAYDLIFYYFIVPDYLSNMFDPQIAAVSNSTAIPAEQKIKLIETLDRYKSPLYMSSINALMSLGISMVISLITALFTIKKRPVIELMSNDA